MGEDNNGQMTLIGQEDVVSSLGPKYVPLRQRSPYRNKLLKTNSQIFGFRICSCLAGKGAGKGKRFQAKVTQLNPTSRQEAETILREHFQ